MYNSDIPTRAELPSTKQLIKSTIIALLAAIVLLITVVLPAEHAIDPTGVGRLLKLTEMGEIKKQLAAEAAADHAKENPAQTKPQSTLMRSIIAELGIGKASATERIVVSQAAAPRNDETTITLAPTQGVEWKMSMPKGATVNYSWTSAGGPVNYDMHGTPKEGGKETSYKAARGVDGDKGTLTAQFDGTHGWFFRNRGSQSVTITLKTEGRYTDLKRVQ